LLLSRWLASEGLLKEAERSVARAHGIKQQDVAGNKFVQNIVNDIADQVEVERCLSSRWIRVRFFSVVFLLKNYFFLNKFGQRLPLIVDGIWQSMWLFVFAVAGTAKDLTTNPGVGKCKCRIPIISLFVLIFLVVMIFSACSLWDRL